MIASFLYFQWHRLYGIARMVLPCPRSHLSSVELSGTRHEKRAVLALKVGKGFSALTRVDSC